MAAEAARSDGSDAVAEGAPLWHGRFKEPAGEELRHFADSLEVDKALWAHDLAGTRAHVQMLASQGLISGQECRDVLEALGQIEAEMASGAFVFESGDEDIHTAIERRATQLAGSAGAKIHTGRSRNDQVSTALRLWAREACEQVIGDVAALIRVLSYVADSLDDSVPPAVMPGYTHLQRAQVVVASHPLRAHCWAFLRDVERLDGVRAALETSVLGAGALGGSTLALDPGESARLLGFTGVFRNSMDAVSDRDFVADLLHCCAMVGVHLSRLGEEWILWSSAEFGYISLDDRYSTGSSMLPQKKNPDIAELARGKVGRLIGNLAGFLATLKGLPLSYNRDLQEDKEAVFDSVAQVRGALRAVTAMVATSTFDTARMAAAASAPELAAIDLAEHLVGEGVPFREAHAIVGSLVARWSAGEGTFAELVAASGRFGSNSAEFFDPVASVVRRRTHGGGGLESAAMQRAALHAEVTALSGRGQA